VERYVARFLDEQARLLARRVAEGRVREGHGDLHAANVCVDGRRLVLFDCLESRLAPLGAAISDRQREIEALEARLADAVRERDALQRDFDALSGQKESVERAMEALTREPPAAERAGDGAPRAATAAAEANTLEGGGGEGAAARRGWVRSLLVARGEAVILDAAPEYAATFRTSVEEARKALHNTLSGQVRQSGRGWPAVVRPRPGVYRLAPGDGHEGPGAA
jgi:hypothetical protein